MYKSLPKGLGELLTKTKKRFESNAYKQLIKAEILKNSGCFKDAIKHYLSSLMADRNNYRTYLGLGMAYKGEERYDKAIQMLEKARELSSFSTDVYFELGVCYLYSHRPTEAMECFKDAIRLDRDNLNAQMQLAVAHEYLEEYDMAILIYHSIIEQDPSCLNAYNHLAAIYMNFEEYKAAGNVFSQILKLNPEYAKAHLGMALCFDKMYQNSRALHYYKNYLDKKPHSRHSTRIKKRIEKLKNKISTAPTKENFLKLASFVSVN